MQLSSLKRTPLDSYRGSKTVWCRDCKEFVKVEALETGVIDHPWIPGEIIRVCDVIGSCGCTVRSDST
jgi:hypothetical protein